MEFHDLLPNHGFAQCKSLWIPHEATLDRDCLPVVIYVLAAVAVAFVLALPFRRYFALLIPEWLRTFAREEATERSPSEPSQSSEPLTRPSRLLLAVCLAAAVFSVVSAAWGKFPLLLITFMPSLASAFIVAVRRPRTTPRDVLFIHLLLLLVQLLICFGPFFERASDVVSWALGLGLCLAGVWVMVGMPMRDPLLDSSGIGAVGAAPSDKMRSPEDNFTAWDWMTVGWMKPLLAVARRRRLEEADVWRLPLVYDHTRMFLAMREMKGTLLWRVFVANFVDFAITVIAIIITTIGGFVDVVFLKLTLSALSEERRNVRAAIAYTVLTFLLRLFEAQLIVLYSWHQRRCYERSRGQMMMALHEKALRRMIHTSADSKHDQDDEGDGEIEDEDEDEGEGESERSEGGAEISASGSESTTVVPSTTASVDEMDNSDETTALLAPSKPPAISGGERKKTWGEALAAVAAAVLGLASEKKKKKKRTKTKKKKATSAAEEPASSGKILDLIRDDVYDICARFWRGADLFSTIPIQIACSVYLIWDFLGPSSFLGLLVVLISQVLSFVLARILLYVERHRRKISDRKLDLTNSFVMGIRHLRWYDWQDEWLSKIIGERRRELIYLAISSTLNHIIDLLSMTASTVFPLVAFYAYTVWSGHRLTVDIAFPSLELFETLSDALHDIPDQINTWLKAWVASGRINSFLNEPDKEGVEDELPIGPAASSAAAAAEPLGKLEMSIAAGAFSWPGVQRETLVDVDVSFPVGLTIVCGRVGSGKSALLRAIIGEMDRRRGVCNVPNEVKAYCDQTPWLESLSLRENILFSTPFEEGRYHEVLDACCLVTDFLAFKGGDLAQIGENGVGLSGGQKARVSLARAVYSRARILLLDDPIAALDHDTTETVLNKLFRGSLLKDRIVVLATHRTDLALSYADQVLEVANSKVRVVPMYEVRNLDTGDDRDDKEYRFNFSKEDANAEAVSDNFIEPEKRAHGSVLASVYWRFVKMGTVTLWLLVALTIVGFRFCRALYYYFLNLWGESYPRDAAAASMMMMALPADDALSSSSWPDWMRDRMGLPNPDTDIMPWVRWYGLIIAVQLFFWVAGDFVMVGMQYISGKRMYVLAARAMAGATFRFYDVTPVGRLLNRMKSDLSAVDGSILWEFHTLVWYIFGWLSSLAIIASATPTFLVVAIVTGAGFVVLFRKFIPAAQSLRRLEVTRLSPLFTNVGVLLDGLATIRAFKAEPHFQQRIVETCDAYQSMDHFYWSSQSWLQYRFDLVSTASTFLLAMFAIMSGLSNGMVAFVLSAAGSFVAYTHYLCKSYGEMQLKFVSVERILELVDVEQEAEGPFEPPASWPSSSDDIVFDNVTVRYAPELEPAIRDVSFRVPAGTTVTVRGRTGSGKSSLVLSLLGTILPDAESGGRITIGGVSVADVNKHALRRRITFVAQDPVLFPGTLRNNLDPMNEHTDEECASVLDRVLNDTTRNEDGTRPSAKPFTLKTPVSAGGKNLSQGQRQLIGMGRAMLRRSTVVILDEPTASVDLRTSDNIQKLLRTELQSCTVINIAHRPDAVSNADWLLEMSGGKVVEFRRVRPEEAVLGG